MSIRHRALLGAVCLSVLLHASLWMLLSGSPPRIAGPALAPRVLEVRLIAARDPAPAAEPAGRRAAPDVSPAAAPDAQRTPASAASRRSPAVARTPDAPPSLPADASALLPAPRPTRAASNSAPAEPVPPPPPVPLAGVAVSPSAPPLPRDGDSRSDVKSQAEPPAVQATSEGAGTPQPAGSSAVDPEATDLDVPPRPLSDVAPAYPAAAGIRSGEVVLDLFIDATGRVRNVVVVNATLPGWFEASAMEAFLRTPFSPGLRDGRPTAARMRVAVVYSASGVNLGGGSGGAR